MKKFTQFINEDKENKIETIDDIKTEVSEMIKTTISNSGGEYKQFIKEYIKNSDDVKVEGFINDSDIYDFFLKWRNDIDEILNDINYFDDVPSELNVFSLYDYIIIGTEKAFKEVVKKLR